MVVDSGVYKCTNKRVVLACVSFSTAARLVLGAAACFGISYIATLGIRTRLIVGARLSVTMFIARTVRMLVGNSLAWLFAIMLVDGRLMEGMFIHPVRFNSSIDGSPSLL